MLTWYSPVARRVGEAVGPKADCQRLVKLRVCGASGVNERGRKPLPISGTHLGVVEGQLGAAREQVGAVVGHDAIESIADKEVEAVLRVRLQGGGERLLMPVNGERMKALLRPSGTVLGMESLSLAPGYWARSSSAARR